MHGQRWKVAAAAATFLILPASEASSQPKGNPPPLRITHLVTSKVAHSANRRHAQQRHRRHLRHLWRIRHLRHLAYLRHTFPVGGKRIRLEHVRSGCDLDCVKIIAVGVWIRSQGFRVGEHPAFGGVCSWCHVYNSAHYRAHAIDVTWRGSDYDARLTKLDYALRGTPGLLVLWHVKGHFDHLHGQIDPNNYLMAEG